MESKGLKGIAGVLIFKFGVELTSGELPAKHAEQPQHDTRGAVICTTQPLSVITTANIVPTAYDGLWIPSSAGTDL